MQRLCADRDVAFIVNDDMGLAKRLGADGVQLEEFAQAPVHHGDDAMAVAHAQSVGHAVQGCAEHGPLNDRLAAVEQSRHQDLVQQLGGRLDRQQHQHDDRRQAPVPGVVFKQQQQGQGRQDAQHLQIGDDRPSGVARGHAADAAHDDHHPVQGGERVAVLVEQQGAEQADCGHEAHGAEGVAALPLDRFSAPLLLALAVVAVEHHQPQGRQHQQAKRAEEKDGIAGPQPGDNRHQQAARHPEDEGADGAEQGFH